MIFWYQCCPMYQGEMLREMRLCWILYFPFCFLLSLSPRQWDPRRKLSTGHCPLHFRREFFSNVSALVYLLDKPHYIENFENVWPASSASVELHDHRQFLIWPSREHDVRESSGASISQTFDSDPDETRQEKARPDTSSRWRVSVPQAFHSQISGNFTQIHCTRTCPE